MALRMKPIPPRPELDALLKEAAAKFNAMAPEEQRSHRQAQRKSWVIGEMLIEHPDISREEVERIYDSLSF